MGVLLLLCLLPAVFCLELTGLQLNDTQSVFSVLDTLPKECTKNGKKFKEGEKFEFGRLRYKCQKYGVYSIEGCRSEKNESIEIGQSVLKDNILHQCLQSGTSVFYRETVCGILGQMDCEKVPKPSGFEKAEKSKAEEPKGKKVNIAGLPEGWSVFEEGAKKIPGTNASLHFRTLMFNPMSHFRSRRQTGHGVGSVVGIEDPGTEKPPMPMEMLMGGKKVTSAPGKKTNLQVTSSKGKPLYTQDLRTSLKIKNPTSYKAGTVGGSRSDVVWSGKTAPIGGKPMAVGPGTFTFGNRPTGTLKKP